MRRLIINADDLGANAARTHGIFQCMEFGVVRSASLFPNFIDSDKAAKHAKERGVPVGLHLNLVEEEPLCKAGDVETLLGPGNRFYPRDKFWALLDEGRIEREHLEREIRAQIEWCFDHGLAPTHVSGNWDCHVHPAVAHALLPLLERSGLRFVRIPCEEPLPPVGFEVPEEQLAEIRTINARAAAARSLFASAGIASTDHFRGHTLLGNASLKNLRHILTRLSEGTTELMVHPGSMSAYGTPFDLDPQRQTELRMLLDDSIPAMLLERKIELIGWGDL
ncbi:MAG: ChbG/HpnK family deacetylase [Candidatus Peribacteraceae bacterium]|nr:ChbG/HpnK family deacetylase [Candidatus Peribacteraceae bacterium]